MCGASKLERGVASGVGEPEHMLLPLALALWSMPAEARGMCECVAAGVRLNSHKLLGVAELGATQPTRQKGAAPSMGDATGRRERALLYRCARCAISPLLHSTPRSYHPAVALKGKGFGPVRPAGRRLAQLLLLLLEDYVEHIMCCREMRGQAFESSLLHAIATG